MMKKLIEYIRSLKSTKIGLPLYFVYQNFLIIPLRKIKDTLIILLRKNGMGIKRYSKLIRLKNKHINERCFIIATGPSLTFEDIEKLRDEKTIAVNSIALVYDKISFKPTYYGIQDGIVFQKIKDKIYESNFPCIFWSRGYGPFQIDPADTRKHWIEFPLNGSFSSRCSTYYFHVMQHGRSVSFTSRKFPAKFSRDAGSVVYDGYSVVFSMLQIAVFMGFNKIYLLGCDCSYESGVENFADYEHGATPKKTMTTAMIEAYKEAKKYTDSHNIEIYNATRGGMLEVFERVDLDRVLLNKNEQVVLEED
jgi:hypothetical protein